MTAIDLREKISDICNRHETWWASDDAQRELRALWGNPGGDICNDCGVFTNAETTRIALENSCYGEVEIAVAPNGWYAIATTYWYGSGGGGYAPSVENRVAYTTRDEALAAGIAELIGKFEGVRNHQGYAPENQRRMAERMIDTLKTHLAQSRQLSLL